ncbi:hypothetical protein AVEN_30094-1 [Araneus ventricosus]|uniref:Uncharacterized protein n=1 Tax=Araneus ventricosus TaxID=182803 RepID=A0A4Y2TQI9_ARAVE|nr:hypothetical protein AVEN_30094-1 [Araneus ventricosus]
MSCFETKLGIFWDDPGVIVNCHQKARMAPEPLPQSLNFYTTPEEGHPTQALGRFGMFIWDIFCGIWYRTCDPSVPNQRLCHQAIAARDSQ